VEHNDFFQKMAKEAMEELAGGERGWKEVDSNTLTLACCGMLYNHLISRIVKPLWLFATSVAAGVIWLIISRIFGIG